MAYLTGHLGEWREVLEKSLEQRETGLSSTIEIKALDAGGARAAELG